MTQAIAIRSAELADAAEIADVHDAAWRFAYRGLLPAMALERMIARRGPAWWRRALSSRVPILVLEAGEKVRGYITYGANRSRSLPYRAEVYELYVQPEYVGCGFGARLLRSVQKQLAQLGHKGFVVWCLSDNTEGCAFYERQGGSVVATTVDLFPGLRPAPTGEAGQAGEHPQMARFEAAPIEKAAYAFKIAQNGNDPAP